MGNAGYAYREFRVIIEDELTQCYVLLMAEGDCPIGVQGWHHKTFPKSVTVMDALEFATGVKGDEEAVLWAQKAPPE